MIIFDGKEPNRAANWFELSQATGRFAEYHCGTPGVEMWLGVSPELTEENVADAAVKRPEAGIISPNVSEPQPLACSATLGTLSATTNHRRPR